MEIFLPEQSFLLKKINDPSPELPASQEGHCPPLGGPGRPWEGSRGLGNCMWHFHTPQVSLRSCPGRDFPSSPVTRALCFPCRVRKFAPWSPARHVERKEKKWDKASSRSREEEEEYQGQEARVSIPPQWVTFCSLFSLCLFPHL